LKKDSPVCHELNLKDTLILALYAATFPLSTRISSSFTSATRISERDLQAVSTAFFAASSQDFSLVPK